MVMQTGTTCTGTIIGGKVVKFNDGVNPMRAYGFKIKAQSDLYAFVQSGTKFLFV
jgi:hypothetical protein